MYPISWALAPEVQRLKIDIALAMVGSLPRGLKPVSFLAVNPALKRRSTMFIWDGLSGMGF